MDGDDHDEGKYPSDDLDDVLRPIEHLKIERNELVPQKVNTLKGPKEELETIYDTLIPKLGKAKERDEGGESLTYLTQRERVLLLEFFTASHAVIENLSVDILKLKLLKADHASENFSDWLFKVNLSQSRRQELLSKAGAIGDGLKGDMNQVRKARNELVHNRASRLAVSSVDDWTANADRALRTVERLYEIKWDGAVSNLQE